MGEDKIPWKKSDMGFESHAEESGLHCVGGCESWKVGWVLV